MYCQIGSGSKQNALLVAGVFGQDVSVRLLLGNGADVTTVIDCLGYSALMFAAGNCSPETVKLLLKHGSDPNWESVDHMTALRLSERRGRNEIAELLKRAGAVK
jgi:ankyrin repeat protein